MTREVAVRTATREQALCCINLFVFMADVKFHDDGEGGPTSHEVVVYLSFRQGNEIRLRGIGGSKKDAAENAVVALNRFQTHAEIEAKTAIALIEDFN